MVIAVEPSRLARLAQDRNARDHAEGAERGLWYDQQAADDVVWFFSQLAHYKGEWAGQPFLLEPWQVHDIIEPLFGWKRADGTRRFREAHIELPRKNGKSALLGGIGLYMVGGDKEPGAEVYSAATKRDQAKIVWTASKTMIEKSPVLREHFRTNKLNINVPRLNAKYEPLGADADTMDGLDPHAALIDELHAHKTRDTYDVLKTAFGGRRQPLLISITTAGVYRPESIGWEQHDHAVKVLEGAIEDDEFFAYITNAEPEDDWTDPAVWARANPNLGISPKYDYIRAQCEKAKQTPGFVNTFLRLHLNIWTASVSRWLSMAQWAKGNIESDPNALLGQPCYAGLDLSSTKDTTALALMFPDGNGKIDILMWFWIPADNIIERERRDRVPYSAWVRDGYIAETPGNRVDYAFIRATLKDLADKYDIQEVSYDPWNASQLVTWLMADGFTMIPMRQGFVSMNAPAKEFESLVAAGNLAHGGNPVLRWQASNVSTVTDDAGNIKPSKKASTEKIDGIVAGIMALDRIIRHQDDTSVYEERGLLTI